jgi:transposase-like protein
MYTRIYIIVMEEDNQIRKYQCSKCSKSNFVLKKVADKQHHGFACEDCWANIDRKNRYPSCIIG